MSKEGQLTCCFTGHRTISEEHICRIPEMLDEVLEECIQEGVTVFRTGGAIGFDTLAALKVLEKRRKYPNIRLELCLPCRDQTAGWNDYFRSVYENILGHADKITYLYDRYTAGCMMERNRMLVDGSQICIGFCVRQKGGSAYTLGYAKKKGLRVINLANKQ